jgi:hypothetical protein
MLGATWLTIRPRVATPGSGREEEQVWRLVGGAGARAGAVAAAARAVAEPINAYKGQL